MLIFAPLKEKNHQHRLTHPNSCSAPSTTDPAAPSTSAATEQPAAPSDSTIPTATTAQPAAAARGLQHPADPQPASIPQPAFHPHARAPDYTERWPPRAHACLARRPGSRCCCPVLALPTSQQGLNGPSTARGVPQSWSTGQQQVQGGPQRRRLQRDVERRFDWRYTRNVHTPAPYQKSKHYQSVNRG